MVATIAFVFLLGSACNGDDTTNTPDAGALADSVQESLNAGVPHDLLQLPTHRCRPNPETAMTSVLSVNHALESDRGRYYDVLVLVSGQCMEDDPQRGYSGVASFTVCHSTTGSNLDGLARHLEHRVDRAP